jgi:chorismate mutase/prephenate dehydratase
MIELNKLRQRITELDEQLLALLAERRAVSQNIAQEKSEYHSPIRDPNRERTLLNHLHKKAHAFNLPKHLITDIYRIIFDDSVSHQHQYMQENWQHSIRQTVAFLGEKGSYSHLASLRYCHGQQKTLSPLHCETFRAIFQAIETGQANWGILPIENTSSGSINEVYDLLQHSPIAIVGELTMPIEHTLLTSVETTLERITTVYSHSQPHQQCSEFLHQLGNIKQIYCASTAEAMAMVAKLKMPHAAAIGHSDSGQWYGLTNLKSNIANQKENCTRFIVIARKSQAIETYISAKTTLIMTTTQTVGALVNCLLILKNRNINITKLESRPIIGNPWEEMFYLDLEAHQQNKNTIEALEELAKETAFIKVLGCYPSEKKRP